MEKIVLALESSCDETAASVVLGKYINNKLVSVKVLSHIVESQIEIHRPFGGVVPEVAARDHLAKIDSVARRALSDAEVTINSCSHIAVTMGPGLIGALMVGVLYARGLAFAANKPLVAVNHVDAHLAPALLIENYDLNSMLDVVEPLFPALALTVSGGHCMLSLLESYNKRIILGKTKDDACGEAFDKVAKVIGLPYPGGPQIETLAKTVEESQFKFAHSLQDKLDRYNFSYSGLKTGVLFAIRKELNILSQKGKVSGENLDLRLKAELAFAFQEAAIMQLFDRLNNALKDNKNIKSVVVAGGVAANALFRNRSNNLKIPVRFAPMKLCSDNATMIALHSLLTNTCGFTQQPFSKYMEGIFSEI